MKKIATAFLTIGLIGFGCAERVSAQTTSVKKQVSREAAAASSLYVISAKAGAVSFVSGKVAVSRNNGKSGYLLKGDNVEKGEQLRTGGDGKAEILLNPGSYVRLSENADFKFDSTSLDDLQMNLTAGSAIFEVITDNDFKVLVRTPKSKFDLLKSGIYRVDALSDGTGKISVWKGKAAYGSAKNEVVKGGQTTATVNGQTAVQKFDRDNKGEFEVWSKERAKSIAQANSKLQQRAMSRSLITSFVQNRGWGSSNRFGLWVYDPFNSGFCFLPFGYGGSSPYGYGFNRSIWDYRLPNQIYNNINPNWTNNTNQQNQNNQSNQNSNFPAQNQGYSRPGGYDSSSQINNAPISRPMNVDTSSNSANGGGSPISAKQAPIDQ
jgi:hypothetical protein